MRKAIVVQDGGKVPMGGQRTMAGVRGRGRMAASENSKITCFLDEETVYG
jgi:hypothetical protein